MQHRTLVSSFYTRGRSLQSQICNAIEVFSGRQVSSQGRRVLVPATVSQGLVGTRRAVHGEFGNTWKVLGAQE